VLPRPHESVTVDRALALVVAAVALAAILYRLPETSLWGDEVASVGLVSQPWPLFWSFMTQNDPNGSLYYLLLRGWLGVTESFGLVPNELVVRLPSVVFAVLAAVVVFWMGRQFWGRTVGVVAAFLYVFNLIQLTTAREARAYSLEVFLLCVSWAAFLVIIADEHRRRGPWAVYVVAMTLAIFAHIFSAIVLASQMVAFAALLVLPSESRGRVRRSVGRMATSVVVFGVAVLPMVLYFLGHGSTNAWLPPASPAAFLRLLWNMAGHDVVYGSFLGAAAFAAVFFTIRARKRRDPSRSTLPVALVVALGCWLCVPVALSYATTQPLFNLHLFSWVYLVVVVPALCLLAGIGVSAVRSPLVRHSVTTCLVVAAAFATPIYSALPPQDFRTAARWVGDRYEAGDGLVSTTWSSSLAMDYYARIGVVPTVAVAGGPHAWSYSQGGHQSLDHRDVAAYAASHPRVFLVSSLQGADTLSLKEQVSSIERAFDGSFVLLADVDVPSRNGAIRVRLYDTGRPVE
jgi:mannosyltransferase